MKIAYLTLMIDDKDNQEKHQKGGRNTEEE
jgi:hypothetical protein